MALTSIDLSDLTAIEGFIIRGDAAGDQAGFSVATAGDVNGDGIADVIVGAYWGDNGGQDAGEAYVIYGKAGSSRTVVDLTGLAPEDGFAIQGADAGDLAGTGVAGLGDVNGDGLGDVIVGAMRGDNGGGNAGEAYVVYGMAGTSRTSVALSGLTADQGFVLQGGVANDFTGRSVSGAGDVNGDGIADMIVGAAYADGGGGEAGAAYVVYGKTGNTRTVLDLAGLPAEDGFVIQGKASGDFAGTSVAVAGDVNGDGLADLIVGAFKNDGSGNDAGEAYVVYGKKGATRTLVDLTGLTAGDGFVMRGAAAGDYAGRAVSGAGDVNGDGIGDLLIGAPRASGGAGAGAAYVVYGKAGETRGQLDLASLAAADGFAIRGGTGDAAGASVAAAGDINGDGIADLIVGADEGSDGGIGAGEAYVIFGRSGTGRTLIDLSTLSVADGFAIQGDTEGDNAGASVSAAGDVNSDGIDDLVVGAPLGDDGGDAAGEAYVIYGFRSFAPVATQLPATLPVALKTATALDLSAVTIADPDETGTMTLTLAANGGTLAASSLAGVAATPTTGGSSISLVGTLADLNAFLAIPTSITFTSAALLGPAAASLRLALNDNDGSGEIDAGVIALDVIASFAPVFDLTSLTAATGFVMRGDAAGDGAGVSVSGAGDVNGDGIADLIVGANGSDGGGDGAGAAYIVYGQTGTGRTLVDLTGLSAATGFVIRGDAAGDGAGVSVSGGGDVNGDGIADLIVGASGSDGGGDGAGAAYIVYGQTGTGRTLVDLTGLSAATGFVIRGDAAGDGAGVSVSGGGDVNGDGIADLIVGASGSDGGGDGAGAAYIVYGQTGTGRTLVDLTGLSAATGFVMRGDAAGDGAGVSVSGGGDVNGDGIADLIVGASGSDGGGDGAGAAYIVYGQTGTGRTLVDLTGLSAATGFVIRGDAAGDGAGVSVSGAGDVNGDGIADLIVGASGSDGGGDGAGAAYIVYGQTGTGRTLVDLTGLSAATGFDIRGDAAGDGAGVSVSGAGDVNGDGIADLIVGASGSDGGGDGAGAATVIYGKAGKSRGQVDLTALSASDGFIIQGDAAGYQAGASVSDAGDVNGDGIGDVLVGFPGSNAGGAGTGDAAIVYGFRNAPSAIGLPTSASAVAGTALPLDLSTLLLIDVDPTGSMTMVLSAASGVFGAAAVTGIASALSNAGATLTLTGSLGGLNAYLATAGVVSYTADLGARPQEPISVVINDQDGAGDVSIGALTLAIANRVPTISGLPGSFAVTAGTSVGLDLSPLALADPDATGPMTVVLGASAGAMAAIGSGGVSVGLADSGKTLSFTGTLTQLNAYFDVPGAVTYTPASQIAATEMVALTLDDLDGSGSVSGGGFAVQVSAAPAPVTPPPVTPPAAPDQLIVSAGGGVTLQGGSGNDTISAAFGNNTIAGGDGNDILGGGLDSDTLQGGAGLDILVGDVSAFVGGADRLEGGPDSDLLQGGGGADVFVFRPAEGRDIIGVLTLDLANPAASTVRGQDFVSGVDKIELIGFGLADGAAALALVSDLDGLATFADQGTTIVIAGLTTASLSADDFQIV